MKPSSALIQLMSVLAVSCGKPRAPEQVAPPAPPENPLETGPFAVTFNPNTRNYSHTLKVNINQTEGKVEYTINTPDSIKVEFLNTDLSVEGCPAAQVIHQTFWLPNSEDTKSGIVVAEGSLFDTRPGVTGTLFHALTGLEGCTNINLTTELKKQRGNCFGYAGSESCQTLVACRNQSNDPVAEIEIWRTGGTILTLHEFKSNVKGDRWETYKSVVDDLSDSYSKAYGWITRDALLRLSFNRTSGVGTLNVDLPDDSRYLHLICRIY